MGAVDDAARGELVDTALGGMGAVLATGGGISPSYEEALHAQRSKGNGAEGVLGFP